MWQPYTELAKALFSNATVIINNKICQYNYFTKQVEEFNNWIKDATSSFGIKEFEKCAKTYINWHNEILNAFKYRYINGPIEGFNNKIKV